MAAGHKSVKRILLRCLEEVNATVKIAKVTSLGAAVNTFRAKLDIQVMNRNGFKEPPVVRNRLVNKHETMIDYFKNTFGDFFDKYDFDRPVPKSDLSIGDCIWICWWQGLDNAPELVRKCVESIQKNAGNHEVIIITEDNYKEYVNIPKWIEEKKKMQESYLVQIIQIY